MSTAALLQAQVQGFLDLVDNSTCSLAGWARDPLNPAPITVLIYRDGDRTTGSLVAAFTANLRREGLPFPDLNHGFNRSIASAAMADGRDHAIYAYGVSVSGAVGPLNGNGKILRCDPLSAAVITTFAGGGGFFRGEGDAAVRAQLGEVSGVAVDRAGNVYASDVDYDLVVKIATNGVLTVVAGNGIQGFSGDGGPARSAALSNPTGLAVDAAGNLYIADGGNARIRRVTPQGTISTVAGGQSGFSGDGGPALGAAVANLTGVAVDATGNLYIVDRANHRIRKVDSQGIITTVAGSGPTGVGNAAYSGDGGPATSARLNEPYGIALDSVGNLYIADIGNNRIRKVSINGTITTIGGNGQCCNTQDGVQAISTPLNGPWAVAPDGAGNLYFSDNGSRVRKIAPDGIITAVAGSPQTGFSGDGGPAISAAMYGPKGVAVDTAGNLLIADSFNNRVRKVTAGTITTFAGLGPQSFGDGGPATSAALSRPRGVAFDRAGNLYIAEIRNHRVRKVTLDSVISTVAGNGKAEFSGDGAFAPSAGLNQPQGIALDASGNLYIADQGNGRVRRVTPAGIISTVAGGGTASPGDGGPAVNTFLSPTDVEVDTVGNLYIASQHTHRIHKVDRNGIITTIAGNGTPGFSGDGGPATAASLQHPQGIAFDGVGNLYIVDWINQRIRKVTPAGIITTVAGNGQVGNSGNGGPAINAALSQPFGVAVDSSGNLYVGDNQGVRRVDAAGTITSLTTRLGAASGDGGPVADAAVSEPFGLIFDALSNLYVADMGNDRVRAVLAAPPSFTVLPASLNMVAPAGSETPVTRQIAVTSQVVGLAWTAQTSESWLSASSASGTMPGLITISADASSLSTGTYRGTITVTAPLAAPATRTVSVEFTVTPGLAPLLAVEPGALIVEVAANTGNPPQQFLRITNTGGGGSISWNAQGEVFGSGNWLGVLSTSGSASGRAPSRIPVRINVAGLQPGIYSGLVHITSQSARQTLDVPVTLLLSQQTKSILTTQTGLRFTAVEGGRTTVAQSLGIINSGQGTMDWTVRPSTLSGGGWLSAAPSTGQSVAGSVTLAATSVQVDPAGLSAGFHVGELRIDAPGANNAPSRVRVDLDVLPAGSSLGVQIRPPQLIFTAQAGTTSPSSQIVRLATPRNSRVEARGAVFTATGGDWLQVLPSNMLLSAEDPRTVVVQPNLGNLAPGVYRAALTFSFDDGSDPQAADIVFVVVSAPQGAGLSAAAPCVPQSLILADRSLGRNFTATAGSAASLELLVVDDCGNAVPGASVVSTFSNGDPPVTLTGLSDGMYAGTWRLVTATAAVTVSLRASVTTLPAAEVQAFGKVQANDTAPALFAGGIVNAASFARGVPLAPGSIVSLFGRNLAAAANAASLPLPRSLGGATLTIGGVDAPLFYSSNGQLNAQLPFELQSNTRQQAAVRGLSTITLPETITIASAAPGIFTLSQDGKGQGAILDTRGRLVDASAPAAAGDVVSVYATGLGLTDPAGSTGQPAGATLSRVTTPLVATVGGRSATVEFAGLAPGFVGLYQVNVQIPAGVTPGSAVQLILSQGGVPSNSVTLAVR